jgi:transcriptional regulator with XRE-family HTH domain
VFNALGVRNDESDSARIVLARNVRKLRAERSLTQEALADLAGVHRNYLGGVERCERNVGIDNLEKLARALSVGIAELVS